MNNIDLAKIHIQEADALFLTSGAGMSVDAGIPDYRSNTGVICQLKKQNYNYNELTTPDFFLKNPQNAWGWYIFQMQKYLNTEPHSGYYLIKDYINKKNLDYFVYTSNLDTMWRRSGFSNDNVIDTLEIARDKYPGSQSSLDALCKRFRIDNSRRKLHTALIDCELLSKVYVNLIDQKEPTLSFESSSKINEKINEEIDYCKRVILPNDNELKEHQLFLNKFLKKNFF